MSLAVRVALAYAVFGVAWIIGSDYLVELLAPTAETSAMAQTLKGLTYVGLSTMLIFAVARQAAQALERERKWFALLFDQSPDAMFVIGPGETFHAVNAIAGEQLGFSVEELQASGPLSLAPSGRLDEARQRLRELARGRARFETTIMRKDGAPIDVEIVSNVILDGDEKNIVAIVRDMTAQRRSSQALAESEARFGSLVESFPEAIAVAVDGMFVWANPAAAQLLSAGKGQGVVGARVSAHVVTPPAVDEDGGRRRPCTVRDGAGHEFPGEAMAVSIQFDGRAAVLYVIRDLRATRDAEVERERLVRAIEQSADAIFMTDPRGTITYVNPAFERITGYSTDEVLGENPRLLKSGKHDAALYEDLWARLHAGREWRGTLTNRRKDGTTYTADTSITPVRDDAGQVAHFVAVERDVTHERELSTQLQVAQKMSAVGRLAGGVAHDFNNMLTVILTVCDLVLEEPLDEGLRADLQSIQDAALRSAGMTRQLLAFARRERAEPRVLDLQAAITESLPLLRRLVDDGIDIRFDARPTWSVLLDPAQLDHVLSNLFVNARDAMGPIGTITITLENVVANAPQLQRRQQEGDFVALTVTDTGQGMDEATLGQIFDPFFTTKAVGKGTGLGLSTVFGIVEQNGGFIDVQSSPGHGASFTLLWPRHEVDRRIDAPPPVHRSAVGRETVLVVDDEVAVVSVCQRLLTRLGYTVLTASGPGEAVQRARSHPGPIHLMVTDVVMPGMTGMQLCAELRAARPELRCLLMSGYPDNVGERDQVLAKPFRGDALVTAVRRQLSDVAPG
jgi:PAS domain S-box-containing protein